MKVDNLVIGHWYSLTNPTEFGELSGPYSYVGIWSPHGVAASYIFQLLRGNKYLYSKGTLEKSMVPCSKSLSDYLNLFRQGVPE